MWAVFLAVTKDLWQFVLESLKLTTVATPLLTVPEFESNHIYQASSPTTLSLRLDLASYPKEKLPMPLSAEEFLLYRLRQVGRIFAEGELLKPVGYFHEAMRGKPGVKISIIPQSFDVMEIFEPTGASKLLFVSEVLEEDRLVVESVGLYTPGQYQRLTLTRKEWQEWRPVFIRYTASI